MIEALAGSELGAGCRRLAALRPPSVAVVATAVLAAVWLVFLSGFGTDLSAQVAWAHFVAANPLAAYDFSWYGGTAPAAYSVLAPYVLAAIGPRIGIALASLCCAAAMGRILDRHHTARPRLASIWLAIGLFAGMIAGRATFTLGLAAALAAICALEVGWSRPVVRRGTAAAAAVLCTLLSPVAGIFLGVAAAAFGLTGRRADGATLAVATGLPLLALGILFGSGGVQPITILSAGPAALAAVLVAAGAPRSWRVVRVGAVIYAIGVVSVLVLPTPVGSNVERLGLLLAGPLLVSMWIRHRSVLVAGTLVIAAWQIAQPVRDLLSGRPSPASQSQTRSLVRHLRAVHADTARVEAVPQYGHWESAELAAVVPLARGWERQVDTVRNPLFYQGTLTAAAYHAWLRAEAVRYVAISDSTPDYAGVQEAGIVRRGEPWLIPAWHNSEWTLYRVAGTAPLASPPASIIATTPVTVTLRMPTPGSTVVRVHWSPFLRVDHGGRLVAAGTWTRLRVTRPGRYTLSAAY